MSGSAVDNVLQRLKNMTGSRSLGTGSGTGLNSADGTPVVLSPRDIDEPCSSSSLGRFLVTKISWRGLYRRILVVRRDADPGSQGGGYLETYHPDTGALTNSWYTSDIARVQVAGEHSVEGGIFVLTVQHGTGTKEVKMACQERAGVMQAIHMCMKRSIDDKKTFRATDVATGNSASLTVEAFGVGDDSGRVLFRYMYASSPGIRMLADDHIALFSNTSHLPNVYKLDDCDGFCNAVRRRAAEHMGINVEVDRSSIHIEGSDMLRGMMSAGKQKGESDEEAPLSVWRVRRPDDPKNSHIAGPVSLVITSRTLIERHVDTFAVLGWKSLSSVAALVRYSSDEQLLGIEWGDGSTRDVFYCSGIESSRDALLAALLYSAQGTAKRPVEILSQPLGLGDPLVRMHYHPVGSPAIFHDVVVESIELKQLQDACSVDLLPASKPERFVRKLVEFNASIPYSGVSSEAACDGRTLEAIAGLLPRVAPGCKRFEALGIEQEHMAVMALHALQRLCCSLKIKANLLEIPELFKTLCLCLEGNSDHVAIEASRLLTRLFTGAPASAEFLSHPPWMEDYLGCLGPVERHQVILQSRAAKSLCFVTDTRCASVVARLKNGSSVSVLLGSVVMELIVIIACFPGAESTDMITRETMIREVSSLGRNLFAIFRDSRVPVCNGLALVMKTLAEGGARSAEPMRSAAMHEGAILVHLRRAMEPDAPGLATSRELVSVWCDGHPPALALLGRVFPVGLLALLDRKARKISETDVMNSNGPPSDNSCTEDTCATNAAPSTMTDIYFAGKGNQSAFSFLQMNWKVFWEQIDQDTFHAGLIWNEACRSELRQQLQNEENLLQMGREKMLDSGEILPSWNFEDFRAQYQSLKPHVQVGGIYIELLMNSKNNNRILDHIRDPKAFISSAYLSFLREGSSQYLKAISMAYKRFCAEIGPFSEVEHIISICDRNPDQGLRYHAMDVLHALVAPESVESEIAVRQIAKDNATMICQLDGISLLCDAVATVHEFKSANAAGSVETKLIMGGSAPAEPKIWYYASGTIAGNTSDDTMQQFEKLKQGPVTKKDIRALFLSGAIDKTSHVYRIGMKQPTALSTLRELRWWCEKSTGPISEREHALMAMESLLQIFRLCPAKEARSGVQMFPVPICYRSLSQTSCLSRITQVILTNDPGFVDRACDLLVMFAEHSGEAMKTIYQTGVFHYILAYSGADFTAAARLLQSCHLKQKFLHLDGFKGESLSRRSILGDFLPESLLFILETYGSDAFAKALVSDSESPEIIWTDEMRCQRLIPHIWNHVGDFASLLKESWALSHDYYPSPPVIYPELSDEIWCHRYYLKHLCNPSKYPNWKIVDHIEFLQSLLAFWKSELAKASRREMSVLEAAKILELDGDEKISESEMKKSYRRLARKYHPDRNPSGRDRFEAVHEAYLRLHSAREEISGPRSWCILLFIHSQCLVYQQHGESLNEFKYAGYPLLLESLSDAPDSDSKILSEEFFPTLSRGIELCWLTCCSSGLNADELVRIGGLDHLQTLFSRCVSAVSPTILSSDPFEVMLQNFLKIFKAIAASNVSRLVLLEKIQVVKDAVACLECDGLYGVVSASIELLLEISESSAILSEQGISTSLVPLLLPRLFGYDKRIASMESAEDVDGGGEKQRLHFLGPEKSSPAQFERHRIAISACRLLSAITSPELVQSMFTPAIARYLCDPDTFLSSITEPVESHLVVWTESMKVRLLEQLQNTHHNEVVGKTYIAGVYVENFCAHPTKEGFDDVEFCKELVKCLHGLQKDPQLTVTSGLLDLARNESLEDMQRRNLECCLDALQHLLILNPKLRGLLSTVASVEPVSSIIASGSPTLVGKGIDLLHILSSNGKCIAAMAASSAPHHLCLYLHHCDDPSEDSRRKTAAECVVRLSDNNRFASFCCDEGGVRRLLGIVVHDLVVFAKGSVKLKENLDATFSCLQALINVAHNPSHGLRCKMILERLLPGGMVRSLLKDDAKNGIAVLHSSWSNPEIIWNREMLSQLNDALNSGKDSVDYDCTRAHVEVDGVYVDILLENPGFPIQHPQSLFEGCFSKFIEELSGKETMEPTLVALLVDTMILLLSSYHPALTDHGISSGCLSKLFSLMRSSSTDPEKEKCFKVIHALSRGSLASEYMARIRPAVFFDLMQALEMYPVLSLEVIRNSLVGNGDGKNILAKAALDAGLVDKLLQLLNPVEGSENSAPYSSNGDVGQIVIFLSVEILKLFAAASREVCDLLELSSIWAAYKNQKQDMFLPAGGGTATSLLLLSNGQGDVRSITYGNSEGDAARNIDEEDAIDDDAIEAVLRGNRDAFVTR
jgi:DnaJ family protein C protein 13